MNTMVEQSSYIPRSLLLSIRNAFLAVFHQVRWRWRFNGFGWKSRLGHCDLLTNPRFINIGRRVLIRKHARLEAIICEGNAFPRITIGDGTIIQFYFHCGAARSVEIGRDVLMGGRVYISDHDHVFDEPDTPAARNSKLTVAPVVIEDGAFLGEGCAILKGVRVGKRAVVAANAVVTKDVPAYTVVAGIPAKPVRTMDLSNP